MQVESFKPAFLHEKGKVWKYLFNDQFSFWKVFQ